MAYLHFKLNPDGTRGSINVYDSDPGIANGEEDVVIEYDFDPNVDFISALELSEDKTSVSNKYPGKTVDEQKVLFDEERKLEQVPVEKERLRQRIKAYVTDIVEPLENDEKKAKEVDSTNGNVDKQRQIAVYRVAARAANNAHEQILDSLTTLEETEAFDPNWTTEFKLTHERPSI